jgi:Fibronectin type III domain
MQFPKREPDIARLAHDLVNGLRANAEDFPSPPVSPDQLQQTLDTYDAAREAAITRYAHAVSGTQEKDEAVDALIDEMKSTLRYAENTVNGDDGKLQLIGWGGRRARTANEVPGQVRTLELIREGKDWVFLDWKQPVDGGLVNAYKIQRRKRDGGSWMDAGMAVETEVLLPDQESGIECEYRVLAVNKLGEGPPSNVVRAVL